MLKTTITKEQAAAYPELAGKVGQTVDASVVQNAVTAAKQKGNKPVKVENKVLAAPTKVKAPRPSRAKATKKNK
jgi:hypothetical protein